MLARLCPCESLGIRSACSPEQATRGLACRFWQPSSVHRAPSAADCNKEHPQTDGGQQEEAKRQRRTIAGPAAGGDHLDRRHGRRPGGTVGRLRKRWGGRGLEDGDGLLGLTCAGCRRCLRGERTRRGHGRQRGGCRHGRRSGRWRRPRGDHRCWSQLGSRGCWGRLESGSSGQSRSMGRCRRRGGSVCRCRGWRQLRRRGGSRSGRRHRSAARAVGEHAGVIGGGVGRLPGPASEAVVERRQHVVTMALAGHEPVAGDGHGGGGGGRGPGAVGLAHVAAVLVGKRVEVVAAVDSR